MNASRAHGGYEGLFIAPGFHEPHFERHKEEPDAKLERVALRVPLA
jgi:hypothetical protein